LNVVSAGMRASKRRFGESSHDRGRYSAKSIGTCSLRDATLRLTPIWQLVTLPADPVYWRCTPTECDPCLRKPVSSMIHVVTGSRSVIAAIAWRAASRRTALSGHGLCPRK
jgi:hypothetical protein